MLFLLRYMTSGASGLTLRIVPLRAKIYADMLKHVTKLPEDLFVASEQTKKTLFAAILNAQGRSAQ